MSNLNALVPEAAARKLFAAIVADYFESDFQVEAEFRRAYLALSTHAAYTTGTRGVMAAALHCASNAREEGVLFEKLCQFWSTCAAMAAAMGELNLVRKA